MSRTESTPEHNNKIDNEIVAMIWRSRFIVADYAGNRGGVHYEAGFAQGLGITVFWTCREGRLKRIHFDTRQCNFITWNGANLLKRKRALYDSSGSAGIVPMPTLGIW